MKKNICLAAVLLAAVMLFGCAPKEDTEVSGAVNYPDLTLKSVLSRGLRNTAGPVDYPKCFGHYVKREYTGTVQRHT